MIVRLEGILESVEERSAVVVPEGGAVAYQVLVPTVVGEALLARVGQRVVLHTMEHLEPVSQGASFIPRIVGFLSVEQRRFFEIFTSAKGLGTRKALRAMAAPTGLIARAICEGDVRFLQTLPEIGKRLAETVIVDLKTKMEPFVSVDVSGGGSGGAAGEVEAKVGLSLDGEAARQAVAALVQLGDTRADAERLVGRALESSAGRSVSPDDLLAMAFSIRS